MSHKITIEIFLDKDQWTENELDNIQHMLSSSISGVFCHSNPFMDYRDQDYDVEITSTE